MPPSFPVHILFGPTASGKSARALQLAREKGGVIINADATQLYQELRILSARPTADEEAEIPHRLYGILKGDEPLSAAGWAERASAEIRSLWAEGRLPILCGGTGLYLSVLQQGISPIPSVDAAVRAEISVYSNPELMALLEQHDPPIAQKLTLGDTQRLRRAVEVWKGTGKLLSEWQMLSTLPFLPEAEWHWEVINPSRDTLYARINQRFLQMMEEGAEEEVERLLARNYPTNLPIMKAVGVPEIAAFLRGECSREEAIRLAQQHSRHYAKRQITWLKNQILPLLP